MIRKKCLLLNNEKFMFEHMFTMSTHFKSYFMNSFCMKLRLDYCSNKSRMEGTFMFQYYI